MRSAIQLLAASSIALMGIACKNTKTAQSDPYNTPAYGANGADPYASEYDNVYEAGGGQAYDNASTYNSGGGQNYSSDSYYVPDSTPSYSPPASSGGAPSSSGGSSHTVQKGDTLFNISRRYGTSVSAIQRANGLNGDLIRIGERLVIP